jgi:hypothetical protein
MPIIFGYDSSCLFVIVKYSKILLRKHASGIDVSNEEKLVYSLVTYSIKTESVICILFPHPLQSTLYQNVWLFSMQLEMQIRN